MDNLTARTLLNSEEEKLPPQNISGLSNVTRLRAGSHYRQFGRKLFTLWTKICLHQILSLNFQFFLVLSDKRWQNVWHYLFKDHQWPGLWLSLIHIKFMSCQNPGQNLTTTVREQFIFKTTKKPRIHHAKQNSSWVTFNSVIHSRVTFK